MSVFKLMRVVVLLSVLFVLLASTWMNERRLANWERPVWVTVYPIVADQDRRTRSHAEAIDVASLAEITQFFERDLRLYGVSLTPALNFQIAPVTNELPPGIPDRLSPLAIAVWSLKMRWWSWKMERNDGLVAPDIQMFVLYHALGADSEMTISVGMRKGMYGVVKAFAGDRADRQNHIVIAHELLHVLGATDKYVFATGDPEFPFGYADPNRRPLFPQTHAEIMGGRIPLSSFESVMPDSLEWCRIGSKTAEEIGLFSKLMDN
jgi:hypothetical protein